MTTLDSFHRVKIGDCTLYLADCREVLPLLQPDMFTPEPMLKAEQTTMEFAP